MIDSSTTTAVVSIAAGAAIGSEVDQVVKIHKSWLDIPIDLLSYETAQFIADITMRDILWPLSILIAATAVYRGFRKDKLQSNKGL